MVDDNGVNAYDNALAAEVRALRAALDERDAIIVAQANENAQFREALAPFAALKIWTHRSGHENEAIQGRAGRLRITFGAVRRAAWLCAR